MRGIFGGVSLWVSRVPTRDLLNNSKSSKAVENYYLAT